MKIHCSPALKSPEAGSMCRLVRLFTLLLLGFCSLAARGQITSGGSYSGTILLNQTNSWTFSANNGDRLVLRAGAVTTTNYFTPWLRLYNPSGVLIADSGSGGSSLVAELAVTTTNNGTFTVTICDTSYGGYAGTGQYRLYFAQFPSSFTTPLDDEGGPLSSGNNYDGTIQLGDLDLVHRNIRRPHRAALRGIDCRRLLQPLGSHLQSRRRHGG